MAQPQADAGALKDLWGLQGGMSSRGPRVVEKKIAAGFEEQIKKSPDVFEQTRLRKHIKAEVADVKKTEIAFTGQKTGWDVSIVEGEFGHKNDESMLVWQERDAQGVAGNQRFFFFVDGKLWKIFIAYNMEAYKDRTFDVFRSAMEDRYGKAAEQNRLNAEGKPVLGSIYWRGSGAYLRAIDCCSLRELRLAIATTRSSNDPDRRHKVPAAAPRPTQGPRATRSADRPNANWSEITAAGEPIAPPKD